ncbi:M48 family metalloprotease, partial [Clostridium sp.]|uniref:M48 family metalloprotease n=1 Tax=Clostridium sp. TaxID=1506 RepID=UPI0026280445
FNEVKSVQSLTTLKDKKIFIFRTEKSGAFAFKKRKVILMPRKMNGYSINQIKFLIAHELAHIEFKYTLSGKELRNLNEESNRIKGIINETMCDLRASKLVKLDIEELEKYFKGMSNDVNECYKYGYFTGEVRKRFVKEYIEIGFDKKGFKERFIENFNAFKYYGIQIEELNISDIENYLKYYFDEFGM